MFLFQPSQGHLAACIDLSPRFLNIRSRKKSVKICYLKKEAKRDMARGAQNHHDKGASLYPPCNDHLGSKVCGNTRVRQQRYVQLEKVLQGSQTKQQNHLSKLSYIFGTNSIEQHCSNIHIRGISWERAQQAVCS